MKQARPQKEYAAIIFDCDGTLTDSMPAHYVAWYRTMRRYGIDFPEDRFYALGGVPSNKIIQMLSQEQGKVLDASAVAIEKENAFLELLPLLVPIEPVVSVARDFRGVIPIAVASGGYREIIVHQLVQIGCHDWFDAVVTAEDTARHKPHPDVFLEAARQLGVNPRHCLVYEDSDLGLEAGRAAEMDCIDVRTFHQPKRLPVEL